MYDGFAKTAEEEVYAYCNLHGLWKCIKAFIHIKVKEQHKYNSNIGCVLIYLQGGTTNEIRM